MTFNILFHKRSLNHGNVRGPYLRKCVPVPILLDIKLIPRHYREDTPSEPLVNLSVDISGEFIGMSFPWKPGVKLNLLVTAESGDLEQVNGSVSAGISVSAADITVSTSADAKLSIE
jgi:hypothetical protein